MARYVASLEDLFANIMSYNIEMDHLGDLAPQVQDDMLQAISRARAWVAMRTDDGEYVVGFAKMVGHVDNDGVPLGPYDYSKFRKTRDETRLDGTEAERRIKQFGGTAYVVGRNYARQFPASTALNVPHPAADAVRAFCRRFGKTENALAEVIVFESPRSASVKKDGERRAHAPEVFAVLLAAINAAGLDQAALNELFERASGTATA